MANYPNKARKKAAKEMINAVGLPGSEDEQYQKPGKDLSKNDAATAKVERTMKEKERRDPTLRKKASGMVETPFLELQDIIPTKLAGKLGVVIGAGVMKKLQNRMIKRYGLQHAYDIAPEALRKEAYNAFFKEHKAVENQLKEIAIDQGKDIHAPDVIGEISRLAHDTFNKTYKPSLDRMLKGKYEAPAPWRAEADRIKELRDLIAMLPGGPEAIKQEAKRVAAKAAKQ